MTNKHDNHSTGKKSDPILTYMKINMNKIRQYEGSRKDLIQIGEYIMM